MIKAGVSQKQKKDSFQAGAEACQEALKQVEGKADILIAFSSVEYDQKKMLEGIKSVAKDIPIAGCSDAGCITTKGPVSKGVSVMAINAPDINFSFGVNTSGTDKDSFVAGMADFWYPWSVTFFVGIYIAVYPFILWFSVLYFIWCREIDAIRTLALGLVFVYVVALPFYLFFPVSNVYTFFDSGSALETVIPGVEQFYYTTTTCDNCFPSLHTAMSLLVAMAVWRTGNRRFGWFAWVVAGLVIVSVLYLAIHWLMDVVAGVVLVVGVSFILRRWFVEGDIGDSWFRRRGETGS